jgi:hypothetical protein
MRSDNSCATFHSSGRRAIALIVAGAALASTPAMAGNLVSGHGNLTDDDGQLRTFSFSANDDGGAYVTGSGMLYNRRLVDPVKVKIDLACAWTDGESALVVGTYRSNGVPIIFGVRDHGEGAGDPTDELSLLHTFADDGGTGTYVNSLIVDGDCTSLSYVVGLYGGVDGVIDTFTVMYEIEAGNMQVK